MRTAVTLVLAGALTLAPAPSFAAGGPSKPVAVAPAASASPSVTPSASPSSDLSAPSKPPFWDVIGRVRYAITQWFSGLVTAALRPVFDLLGRTVFSTPSLDSNAHAGELWRFSLGIADASLALFVLAGAGIVTVGAGLTSQMTAKEMLPRLVLAAFMANLSMVVLGEMIHLSSALAQAMLGAGLDPAAVSGRMISMLGAAALGNPFLALFALAVVVLGILVIIAYILRVAALVILATAAPLMLACHALPQTEGIAKAWWRATLALLAAPVAQSMLLAAAFRIFLSSQSVLGLPTGSGLIDLLVVASLLYLLYKIPFWALNAVLPGSGSKAWGRTKGAAKTAAKAAMAA